MRRTGTTSDIRIHDFGGKFRPTFGIDKNSVGGCFAPAVFAYFDRKGDSASGIVRRGRHIRLPFLSWARAYKLRRYGGLYAYRIQHYLYRVIISGSLKGK